MFWHPFLIVDDCGRQQTVEVFALTELEALSKAAEQFGSRLVDRGERLIKIGHLPWHGQIRESIDPRGNLEGRG